MKFKKSSKILLAVIAVLIVARIALPSLLLPRLNSYLKDFSTVYTFHMEDLDISILRGAYRFEGLTGKLRTQNTDFINANFIDVSLSWRELLRGRILSDIIADGVKFNLTQELLAGSKTQPTQKTLEEGKQAKRKLFPIDLARFEVRNSEFRFSDAPGVPPELQLYVTGLDASLSNVTATPENPISLFVGKGSLMESGNIKVVGELKQSQKPIDWNFDIELKEFELTKLNPFLKRKLPLTFETGKLDLYSEVRSENSKIEGYLKPFLKQAHFIGDQSDFKGLKHLGIELTTAAANALLKSSKDKSVATKILFSYEKDNFQWNAAHAISSAIAHGFEDKLQPGIENVYSMNPNSPKEIAHD